MTKMVGDAPSSMSGDDTHPVTSPVPQTRTREPGKQTPEAIESPRSFIQRRMAEIAAAERPKRLKAKKKK